MKAHLGKAQILPDIETTCLIKDYLKRGKQNFNFVYATEQTLQEPVSKLGGLGRLLGIFSQGKCSLHVATIISG